MEQDSYKTIAQNAEALFKDKGSRFISFAFPVENETVIKEHLESLRKKYYDATHHCYAWRLGAQGEQTRVNDDGEPSGTAGKPILGQMLSSDITNTLIVVVRYFGGTKLGVSGLINAYKESAKEVIRNCVIITRTVNRIYNIRFSYFAMNDVMRNIKEYNPEIIEQIFDNLCILKVSIRQNTAEEFSGKLMKIEGVELEEA